MAGPRTWWVGREGAEAGWGSRASTPSSGSRTMNSAPLPIPCLCALICPPCSSQTMKSKNGISRRKPPPRRQERGQIDAPRHSWTAPLIKIVVAAVVAAVTTLIEHLPWFK